MGNVGIGHSAIENNSLLVRSGSPNEDEDSISTTVQIQKYSHAGDNQYVNPKALRVVNQVQAGVSATEWAISGELDSYTELSSLGNTATSGVARKYNKGQVFGGHFQAKDLTGQSSNSDLGGSIVGAEINLSATGDDDYTTPNGYPGIRIGLDMPAHTESNGEDCGKYAAGIRVRNSTDGGVWKKGVHIYDHYIGDFGAEPMSVGLEVTTSGSDSVLINGTPVSGLTVDTDGAYGAIIEGDHSLVDLYVVGGDSNKYGIVVSGKHSNAAIQIPEEQYISLESTNQVKFRYEVFEGEGRIQFYVGERKIGYLATSASENKRLN
ncbi:hypothetical protein [Microbulbifer sp. JMSA003]|uniref:hypothetical protein n=1 Tax=Microbulbifer sp. JMSA003 TaxID=3243369 RepID=UPI00403A26A6